MFSWAPRGNGVEGFKAGNGTENQSILPFRRGGLEVHRAMVGSRFYDWTSGRLMNAFSRFDASIWFIFHGSGLGAPLGYGKRSKVCLALWKVVFGCPLHL